MWWYGDKENPFDTPHEPKEVVYERIDRLKHFLKTREEKVVTIVCHGMYLRLLSGLLTPPKNCGVLDVSKYMTY